MVRLLPFLLFMVLLITMTGCGGPRPVIGGTNGELAQAGMLLGDVRVTIHRVDGNSYECLGFGDTDIEGRFQLVLPGAKGPLHLAPGEYCCTLESIGTTILIPKEYSMPDTTPVKISWTVNDATLELELPPTKSKR